MSQFNFSKIEEAARFIQSEEFRSKLESQAREFAKLASDTAQKGAQSARRLSETAISEAQDFQKDLSGRATAFSVQLREQAKIALERLREVAGNSPN